MGCKTTEISPGIFDCYHEGDYVDYFYWPTNCVGECDVCLDGFCDDKDDLDYGCGVLNLMLELGKPRSQAVAA